MANPPLQSMTLEDLKKAKLYAPLARQQAFQEAAAHLEAVAADYEQMSNNIKGGRPWDNLERNRLKESVALLRGLAKTIGEKA